VGAGGHVASLPPPRGPRIRGTPSVDPGDVIPSTGHTGDSEALEHRLEHMIMRKQEQVDALERARKE
jgi:hypothetical protein